MTARKPKRRKPLMVWMVECGLEKPWMRVVDSGSLSFTKRDADEWEAEHGYGGTRVVKFIEVVR